MLFRSAAVATATVAFTFGGGVAFAGTAANIRVTDIRDVSAVVSWTGTAAEAGTVQYAAAVNGTCATSAYGSSAIDARGSGTRGPHQGRSPPPRSCPFTLRPARHARRTFPRSNDREAHAAPPLPVHATGPGSKSVPLTRPRPRRDPVPHAQLALRPAT